MQDAEGTVPPSTPHTFNPNPQPSTLKLESYCMQVVCTFVQDVEGTVPRIQGL